MFGFFVIKLSANGVHALGQEDFTPAQRVALAHIVNHAGQEPAAPGPNEPVLRIDGNTSFEPKGYSRELTGADVKAASVSAQVGEPSKFAPEIPTAKVQANVAKAQGYTGDSCTQCHSFTVKQTGKCTVCENCGATSGCS